MGSNLLFRYLSYWYTGIELPTRLSFFWVAYQSTSIVSAFLAFGVLHMRGVNGMAGWRWVSMFRL